MANAAVCCASGDADFAAELAHYLSVHTSLRCELVEAQPDDDFLDVVEQCLTYEFLIAVLSPQAIPSLWPRTVWERVLVDGVRESGTQVAYVMRQKCGFPAVLQRRQFFEAGQRRLLRRWVLDALHPERTIPGLPQDEEEDQSLVWLTEEPGVAKEVRPAAAVWMVRKCWQDFEEVCWIDCAHRSGAGILGEMASELQLRLTGTPAMNWAALCEHANNVRGLYVFEQLAEDFAMTAQLGGKASVLVLTHGQEVEKGGRTAEWTCIREWSAFMENPPEDLNWPAVYSTGMVALRMLLAGGRLAEAHESVEWLADMAKLENDTRALGNLQWEESWILDHWDLTPRERTGLTRTQAIQLWLPLEAAASNSSW